MFNVVTRVKEHFSLSVELKCVTWLIHFLSALKILLGTLRKFSLGCVNNLVQIVNLSEVTVGLIVDARLSCGGKLKHARLDDYFFQHFILFI